MSSKVSKETVRVCPERVGRLEGEAQEVPGDCRPPDRPQELRPPEGQALLRNRQVGQIMLW